MRERKFLAGLGTILVIGGIYCFKAAFSKKMPVQPSTKIWLCLAGTVCIAGGIFLVVTSFPEM